MVKLPDQFSAGMAPSMDVRPFSPPNLGLEARAKGIAALAQGFASMAGSMGDAAGAGDKQQDALDLIKADTGWHSDLNATHDKIANSGDYTTYTRTFDQDMGESLNRNGEVIGNPKARELWEAKRGLDAVNARGRVMAKASDLYRQDQKTQLMDSLNEASANIQAGKTEEDRLAAQQNVDHYLQIARDSKIISPFEERKLRDVFLEGGIEKTAKGIDPFRRFETLSGVPYSQYQTGQTAQPGQSAGTSAGQPGAVTGPAATMLGQPGAQVAPRAGEILGTPTVEKPLQDRLVPAAAGPQPQAGAAQTQTVPNPFLPGQQAEGRADAWTSEGMQPAKSPQSTPQSIDLSPSDRDRLIRTVATEAANPHEQTAIASVLRNRLQAGGWYGSNVMAVTRPNQFEVWNNGRAASVRQDSPEYKTATAAVDGVFGGTAQDQTGGATHFYSPKSQDALGRKAPDWASTFTNKGTIGDTAFYQDPRSAPQAGTASQLTYQPPQIKSLVAESGINPRGRMIGVEGLVVHHTAGGGGPEGVLSTFRERGVSAQYIMDRDGQIYRAVPEGSVANHILTSYGERQGFSNKNVEGIEVIARNNNDWTPAQKQAIQQFAQWHQQKYGYDPQNVLGHGEVNPGHKEADEGFQGVLPWRQSLEGDAQQPNQQRYQIAQAPSNGVPVTTDAGYGNGAPTRWNNIELKPLQGEFAGLSPLRRMKLLDETVNEIHSRKGEMYQQTLTDVGNDTAAMARDGTVSPAADGTTAIERARQILRPDDFNKELKKYKAAEYQFKVISPIQDMSEEQYDQHIGQLSPKPGDPDFAVADAIIKKAGENWDKLQTVRATDPAGAVDSSKEVLKFKELAANPPVVQQLDGSYARGPVMAPQQMVHGLIQARLAAQSRLGIDPEYQRIVSQQEASRLLKLGENNKDIKQLSDVDLMQRVKSAANRAEALYGPEYAKRAIEESMKYLVNDDMRRELGASAAASVLMGQAPKAEDIRALEMAHMLDPMATMRDTFNGKPGVLDVRPDRSLGLQAAAVTPPPGMAQPNKQQAAWLSQNPDGWQAFDKKFGAGSAARVLAPGAGYGKTSIQGPVSPGLGQGIKNLFMRSPESAMFGATPQATMRPSDLPGAMEAGQ